MHKRLIALLCLIMWFGSTKLHARSTIQNESVKGIQFTQLEWKKILNKASKDEKLIFIDCYTTWCGPCKLLAKNVFTDSEVGHFFNEHFINVKLDMEKELGMSLKTVFGVNAYPTLLIIDEQQNVIHKSVGALQKEELLKFAKDALQGVETLSSYHEKYREEDVANKSFVVEYLNKLESANEKETLKQVVQAYFTQLEKSELLDQDSWDLFVKHVHSIDNKAFQIVLKHQQQFSEKFGLKAVEDKVYFTFLRCGNQLCDKLEDGTFVLNEDKKKNFLEELNANEVKNKSAIKAYSEISTARQLKDWNTYISSVSKYLKADVIDKGPMSLYNYALPTEKEVTDKKLRSEVAQWCEMGMKIEGLHQAYLDAFKKLKDKLITE